jgi:ribose transport system substrate-binding protein
MGWTAVDIALRYAQRMTVASGGGGLPFQLLTKRTLTKPRESVDVPADYREQFMKLWQVA